MKIVSYSAIEDKEWNHPVSILKIKVKVAIWKIELKTG